MHGGGAAGVEEARAERKIDAELRKKSSAPGPICEKRKYETGEQGRDSDTRLAATAVNHGGQRNTPDLPATGERRITRAVMSDFR